MRDAVPLPPLRHPPRPTRAQERGSVGSARVWTHEQRASSTDGAPEPAARNRDAIDPGTRERMRDLEHRRPALALRLRGALSRSELPSASQGEVLGQVLSWIEESAAKRSATGEPAPNEDARALEILERRLAKLRTSLRTARELQRRLLGMSDHDPGIASIYRAVQGLTDMDALLEVKREILREIFHANLALQARPA